MTEAGEIIIVVFPYKLERRYGICLSSVLELLFLLQIEFKILEGYLTVAEYTALDRVDIIVDRFVKSFCAVVNVNRTSQFSALKSLVSV